MGLVEGEDLLVGKSLADGDAPTAATASATTTTMVFLTVLILALTELQR